jgi:Holliday junction DNA helicase RuvA
VLSGVSTDHFARLVHAGDVVALTKIPGIGKRPPNASWWNCAIASMACPALPGASRHGPERPLDAAARPPWRCNSWATSRSKSRAGAESCADAGDSAEAIIRKALRAALGG